MEFSQLCERATWNNVCSPCLVFSEPAKAASPDQQGKTSAERTDKLPSWKAGIKLRLLTTASYTSWRKTLLQEPSSERKCWEVAKKLCLRRRPVLFRDRSTSSWTCLICRHIRAIMSLTPKTSLRLLRKTGGLFDSGKSNSYFL
jgi:hypothetical protein